MLSDSDDGGEDPTTLTINEHYAKAFEYRKEREELEKLKAKYGSDYEDSDAVEESTDSESAESEDENGEELTPAVDAAILRTLARIRRKDPEIYESEKNIFGEEQKKISAVTISTAKKPKDKSKPITLRKVAIDSVLRGSRSPSPNPEPLPHVLEQAALRDETIAAFHTAAAGSGDEDDGLLIPREKTKDEQQEEEEAYRAFLEREVGDLRELLSVNGESSDEDEVKIEGEGENKEGEADGDGKEGEEKKKKKKKKKSKKIKVEPETSGAKKSKAENDQEFLLEYILNRGWIDRSANHIPTYGEVTSPVKEKRKKDKAKEKIKPEHSGEEDEGLLSDSSFDSLASHFETSYNHRFEEPGADAIPSFPRNLPSLVRRADTTRKEARERRKQRKEEELQKKKEEVRRLKALKMREVRRKLELIGKESGLDGVKENGEVEEALRELDLEGEWDPEKHDRQMAGLFDQEGDDEVEEGWGEDAEIDETGRPVWKDEIDIGDIPMSDDDVVPAMPLPSGSINKKEDKKKKKKKKKKGEEEEEEDLGVDVDAMDADRPVVEDEEWDGTEEMRKKKLDEYMDEIYGLDFNDMVGDLPTRFKYTPVQPQTYSLTPVEILMATDQELNEYMSVKKYAPYRQEKARTWDGNRQEKLKELKGKLGERFGGSWAAGEGSNRQNGAVKKKRKGKKERMKMKDASGENGVEDVEVLKDVQDAAVDKDSSKKKRKDVPSDVSMATSDDQTKKRKRIPEDEDIPEVEQVQAEGKKKRRRRNKKEGITADINSA